MANQSFLTFFIVQRAFFQQLSRAIWLVQKIKKKYFVFDNYQINKMLKLKVTKGLKRLINALQQLQALSKEQNQGKIIVDGKDVILGAINQKLELICQQFHQFDYLLDEENNFSNILKALQKQFIQEKAVLQTKMENILKGHYQQIQQLFLDNQNNPKMLKQIAKKLKQIDQKLYNEINIIQYLPNLQLNNEFVFQQIQSLQKAFSFYNHSKNVIKQFKQEQPFKISQQSLKQPVSNYLQYYQNLYDQALRNIYSFKYQTIPEKLESFFRKLQKLASSFFPQKYQNIKANIFSKQICQDFNIKWPSFEGKSIADRVCLINRTFREQIQNNFENTIYLCKRTLVLYSEYYYKYFDENRKKIFLNFLKKKISQLSAEIQLHSMDKTQKTDKQLQVFFKSVQQKKPSHHPQMIQNNLCEIITKLVRLYFRIQLTKLDYIFTQFQIDFKKTEHYPEIIQETLIYIKRQDQKISQKIEQIKKSSVQLLFSDERLNYVRLIKKAYIFYCQITDIIQYKIQQICLKMNIEYFKASLYPFVERYEHLYENIMENINKLKYKSIPQSIEIFLNDLEQLVFKLMPDDYADIKKRIFKIKFNEDFNLNCYIPQNKSIAYRIRKYNQVLMDAIETDFTTVINIFKQSSIKFYNYLEGKHQKRYLQLLKDRFDDQIQNYWQHSKNGEEDEQCLKELFKVIPQPSLKGQLQSQFQEIKDEVQSNKRQIENKFKQQSQSNNFNEMVNIYNRMNRNDQSRFKNQLLKAIKDDFQQITSTNTPQTQRIQKYRYVCEKYENHPTVTQMFSQRYQELKLQAQQAMIGQIQALINQNKKQIRNIDTAVQIDQLIKNNKVITDSYIQFIQRNINVFQNILTKIQDYFEIVIYKHSEYDSSTSESQIFTICTLQFEQVQKQITKQYLLKQIAKPIINELTQSRNKIQIFRNSQRIRDILHNQNRSLQKIVSQLLIMHKQISNITFSQIINSSIHSVDEQCKKYLQEIRKKVNLLRNIEPIYIKYGLSNLKIEGNTSKIGDLQSFKKNISKQVNKGIQQIYKLQKNPQKQLSIRFNLIYTLCNFWITNHEKQLSEFMINIYKNLLQSLQKVFQDFQNLINSFNLFIRVLSNGIFTSDAFDQLSKSQIQFCKDSNNFQTVQIIIANLIIMQKMQTRMHFYQQKIKEKTVSMVQSIKKIRYLQKLVISEMKTKLGAIPEINAIARKYAVFQPVLQVQKAEKKDIKQLLFQLKNNHKKIEQNIDLLLKDYQSFEQSFRKTLSRYGQNQSKQTIEAISKGIYNSLQQQKCQLIGKILGLYSILKIKLSNQLNFRPHISQFVAISLLLSFDYNQSSPKLNRNVLQMLPGEGKSLVIAITACYLALKGYKVYQICYSKYLANRDYQEFKQLFKVLDIQKNIKYNVVSSLCKQIFIPIKQLMQKELVDPSPKQKGWLDAINKKFTTIGTSLAGHSTNVILFDQIDILFSNQIQGKVYAPTLSINDGNISREIMNIFEQIYNRSKKQYLTLESLQKTQAYADLLSKYPRISQILKFQIIRMLNDVLDEHKINEYYQSIKSGKQNQRQQGFDGYYLQFAYIKLKQNNKSSQKNIKNNLKIYFKIGKFSYCQLIKNYGKIVGVGGALKCLSEMNKQSLHKQYNIQNVYYLPSIYQISSLIQKQSIIEYKQREKFYRSIYKQIKEYFQNNDDSQKAIIVFFKNRQELQYFNYVCSTQKINIQYFALHYLTTDSQLNEDKISKVTCKNVLTLAMKQYSRGIDYKDRALTNGLFVIQTYLPDNLQDCYQAKGRTARQGKPGIFKLIVSDYELSKIQKGVERFINESQHFWKQRSQQNYKVRQLLRKQAKRLHEKALEEYQSQKTMQYIQQINTIQIKKNQKQILLIFGFQGNLTDLEQYKKWLIQDLQRLEYIINKYTLPINLKYQICYFGNYTNQNLLNIFKTSKISSFPGFKQEMRNMESFQITNKLHYIGESIQLFFNYVSKLSQKEKVSSCFVFSSQRNYSWTTFKQTQRFKRYGLNIRKILKIGRQIKSCQEQLKYIKSKNISMNFIGLNCLVQSKRQIQQYSRYFNQKTSLLHIRQLNNFKPYLNKFFFQKIKQIIPYLKGKQI